MRFAQIVFTVAGIWGIVVLAPFYWLVDVTGRAVSSRWHWHGRSHFS